MITAAGFLRSAALAFGWIPAALLTAPVVLDASEYGGYRPDSDDLVMAVTVLAAIAGLCLGYAAARRRTAPLAGLVLIVVAAVVCFVANDAVYRWIVPLAQDLREGGWGPLNVLAVVVAAAAGFGLGLFRKPREAPLSRRLLLVAAALTAVAGLVVVPEFVRVGGELSTSTFVPPGTTLIDGGQRATVQLDAGRHALFGYFGSEPCDLGRKLSRPSVEFTDNSDSIVTELLGTFELPQAGPVTVVCGGRPGERFEVGDLPVIRGPLSHLVYAPVGVPLGLGLLPGALLAAWALRRPRRS
ncbi:hypothetical protein [Actinoplanes friuliensis]|uniref:Uncharacterized protein n=1 Tax=Actinoplanes friuliensis DSM 7358 TaxID=1246995 RepID=U5W6M0_9ACTN|nr:hypothetical protein [Actinoplanes friuliensis]AGZ43561.1 hypothetical protein AFR_26495 [Actinoplanes friuliensis DSM 7358]